MKQLNSDPFIKKKRLIVLIIVLAVLLVPTAVFADSYVSDEAISVLDAGETIDGIGLFAGNTVRVDGDDFTEPIADAVRSILDGHIVLTRDLADQSHFPAIDVLKSISRLRSEVVSREDMDAGRTVLRLMSTYKRVEDMVNIGAYQKGASADIDHAIEMVGPINAFLQQNVGDCETLDSCFAKLKGLAGAGG